MSVSILRQLSAGYMAIAVAFRQAADEAEGAQVAGKSAEVLPADTKPKGKPGRPAKAKQEEPADDPLAGLTGSDPTGGDSGAEPEQGDDGDDPLAGLMGGDEPEEPADPPVTKQELAKILGDLSNLVDKARGEGQGTKALVGLFKKHGAENLKMLKEEEFLAVKNEANAVIDAIKKMTAK